MISLKLFVKLDELGKVVYIKLLNQEFGDHLSLMLEEVIKNNIKEIQSDLIGDLSHIHERAVCLADVDVCDVQYQYDNNYLLSYTYQWHVYNGCAGLDDNGEVEESVSFYIDEEGDLHFEFLEVEERTTFEEF